MFLSELNIWNFRKYGIGKSGAPGLHLIFNEGLNLLVGENDSGKTAIIDAIKFVLQTQSHDYQPLEEEDFFLKPISEPIDTNREKSLKIECILRGFDNKNNEAANFLEWLGIEKNKDGIDEYFLKIALNGNRKDRKITYNIKAGPDDEGNQLDGAARDFLRVTYLKPLRDAERELIPGRRSRLAQILKSHEAFSSVPEGEHKITEIAKKANEQIEGYFEGKDENDADLDDKSGKRLLSDINEYLEKFFMEEEKNKIAKFKLSGQSLSGILEKLMLNFIEENPGLGSYNRLYIATELLLLKRSDYYGLKLSLIEEIEAHLHPQAQLRAIEYLQDEIAGKSKVQLIMTTHSPNLASKIKLNNLIICKDDKVFSMRSDPPETVLEKGDYAFLERFLDVTKANLFFAHGVILVEGDAENILIPVIANILDRSLAKHGVSVVNVQSTAFLRYSRIFRRKSGEEMGIKVAVVTDNDIEPDSGLSPKEIEEKRAEKEKKYNGQGIKTFISPDWTLEYDIALSTAFREEFYNAVLCAEKIQNSNAYGLTSEKIEEINQQVKADFDKWNSANKTNKEIAKEIYENYILAKTIRKPIIAQCFTAILFKRFEREESKERLRKEIELDEKLKYIVDAIKYVTG